MKTTKSTPKPPRVPKGLVASELLARRVRQTKWIVSDLFKPGLVLFAGAGKLGKSLLAMELSVAVATGTKALQELDVQEGTVLYLGLEEHRSRLTDRLSRICDGRPQPEHLKFFLEWTLDERGITKLDNLIKAQLPRTRLVVVDTIALAKPPGLGSGYLKDYAFMRTLQRLALRRRIGLVCVTHLTKQTHADFAADVAGSMGAFSSCDTLLHLSKPRGSTRALLRRVSREAGEAEIGLDLASDGRWRLAPEVPEEASMTPERLAIVHALRSASSPLMPREVGEFTGLSANSSRVLLCKMLKVGQVKRVMRGFTLPDPVAPVMGNDGNDRASIADSQNSELAVGGRVINFSDFIRPAADRKDEKEPVH